MENKSNGKYTKFLWIGYRLAVGVICIVLSMIGMSSLIWAKEDTAVVCRENEKTASQLISNLTTLNDKLNGRICKRGNSKNLQESTDRQGLMPSEGTVQTLVLMVEFEDVSFNESFTKEYVEENMFGETDTHSVSYPYESLRAYYQRASYGRLDIDGEVVKIKLENTKEYYTNSVENPEGETRFWTEVESYVQALGKDWEEYDFDKDGYVDSFCTIVAGTAQRYAEQWWSCCLDDTLTVNASYEIGRHTLLMESQISGNTGTMIHEYGHMLGLPDLYDVGNGSENDGIHTGDMMNNNIGDLNAFCKMMLGWISPANIKTIQNWEELSTLELKPYGQTGDCAVLYVDKENLSLFGEYYLITYRDVKQGFDEQQSNYYFGNDFYPEHAGENFGNGLRIYHVNAAYDSSLSSFRYDNSSYPETKLIEYVDRDGEEIHGIHSVNNQYWNYRSMFKEYNCDYREGDELTPYTTPSSAKHNQNHNQEEPWEFSGLHVTNIKFYEEKATFDVFYEAEPSEQKEKLSLSFCDTSLGRISYTLKKEFQMKANRDLWCLTPEALYMRKKGTAEKVGKLELNMTNTVPEESLRVCGHYTVKVSITDCTGMEADTKYEIVFPSGTFQTATGEKSEELILELETQKDYMADSLFTLDSTSDVDSFPCLDEEGSGIIFTGKFGIDPNETEVETKVYKVVKGEVIKESSCEDNFWNTETDKQFFSFGMVWKVDEISWGIMYYDKNKMYIVIINAEGEVKQRETIEADGWVYRCTNITSEKAYVISAEDEIFIFSGNKNVKIIPPFDCSLGNLYFSKDGSMVALSQNKKEIYFYDANMKLVEIVSMKEERKNLSFYEKREDEHYIWSDGDICIFDDYFHLRRIYEDVGKVTNINELENGYLVQNGSTLYLYDKNFNKKEIVQDWGSSPIQSNYVKKLADGTVLCIYKEKNGKITASKFATAKFHEEGCVNENVIESGLKEEWRNSVYIRLYVAMTAKQVEENLTCKVSWSGLKSGYITNDTRMELISENEKYREYYYFVVHAESPPPPTEIPTTEPTTEPTEEPTAEPTGMPTTKPTEEPAGMPTTKPTEEPAGMPTTKPTEEPAGTPTAKPTGMPVEESIEKVIATPAGSRIKVTHVTAKQTANLKAKITWKRLPGKKSYVIYRASKRKGTYKKMKTVSGKTWTDASVIRGNTYYYRILIKGDTKKEALEKADTCKIKMDYLIKPILTIRKGITSDKQKYVEVKIKNYKQKNTGKYAQIYVKSTGKWLKPAMKKKSIRSWRGCYRFKYSGKGLVISVKVRTYKMISGKKRWSSYSKVKKIKI